MNPKHPARARSLLASLLLATLLATAGCETTGGLGGLSGEARAERLALQGEHADAAGLYIGLASEALGDERDRLTLLAVEQWLYAGDTARAESAFASVRQPADGNLRRLWLSSSAAFALSAGDAERALQLLEPLSREPLPLEHRLRVDLLRADAWLLYGDPARAVEIMQARESRLDGRREREANRQRLWLALKSADARTLRDAAEVAGDPDVRGWLSLGALAAATGEQGFGWANGVLRWRNQFPDHPAVDIVDDLRLPDDALSSFPETIALLLPLSGNAAGAGAAIQHGFLGAYFASAGGLDERQRVRVYDVTAEGGASAAYMRAVQDGADFVVGPLLPRSVSELANDILVPVPVLTLNYLPNETLPPPGLYQFALAPEDEAAAVADRAIADGHRYALALVPSNSWGRRVFESFATRFEALGGTLLDYRQYSSNTPDFSNTIENLMGLAGSVQRYRRLRANLGGTLQFDPRRRQDADFIFLAADAASGRLLKSQLKFHYSGDLPVYSTSSINAMDGRSNSDLNGIVFADTPWLIRPQAWIAELPSLFAKYWPEQRRLGRLHAMGYDAYHLVASLYAARGGRMEEVDGATGRLYLDYDGRVHRQLAFAQFQNGQPVALPDPLTPGGPLFDRLGRGEIQPPDAADPDGAYEEPWYEPIED